MMPLLLLFEKLDIHPAKNLQFRLSDSIMQDGILRLNKHIIHLIPGF